MSMFSRVFRVFRRQIQVRRRAAELIRKHQTQAYDIAVRESLNDWPDGRGQFYLDVSKEIRRLSGRSGGGDGARLTAAVGPASPGGDTG